MTKFYQKQDFASFCETQCVYFFVAGMQVTIELIDVNDHAPQFSTQRTRVRVSEGSLPGASISLPPARDLDSPPVNGVAEYRLVDETSCSGTAEGAPFDLRVERQSDGSDDVRLVLQSPGLDRELCDRYTLTIVASDAGSSPQKGGKN